MANILQDIFSRSLDVGETWANAAILGKDKATEIEMRAAEQDKWSRLNGSGPNDRAGATQDADKGPVELWGFGSIAATIKANPIVAIGVAAGAVLVGYALLRK